MNLLAYGVRLDTIITSLHPEMKLWSHTIRILQKQDDFLFFGQMPDEFDR